MSHRRALQLVGLLSFLALVLVPPGVPTGGHLEHPCFYLDPYLVLATLIAGAAPALLPAAGALLMVGLTAFKGAFFCRVLCPLGAVQDLVPRVRRVASAQVRVAGPPCRRACSRPTRLRPWVLLVLLAGTALHLVPAHLADPMSLLAQAALSLAADPGPAWPLAALVAILASGLIQSRFYCRHLCPLGALYIWVQIGTRRSEGKTARPAPAGPLLTRRQLVGAALALPLSTAARSVPAGVAPLRPPGALPEAELLRTCVRCGQCVAACPTGAIVPAVLEGGIFSLGSPRLALSRGPCLPGCTACQQVCPSGALTSLTRDRRRTWRIGAATIRKNRCLRSAGKDCDVCRRVCPYNALTYPIGDSLMVPVVERSLCIGCGICEHACPAPGGLVVERETSA